LSSIYIHIPFCEHKCIYCDFYSIAPSGSEDEHRSLTDKFLFALESEILIRAEDPRFNEPVETIFFGGGTPSLLHPSEIKKMLKLISSKFPINKNTEITLETNPGTVNKESLKAFRATGVNRLSVGIQSFHDDDLKFLTRIHNANEAKQCIRDAFDSGFENVSVDLIFSLPNQTMERWKSNLEQAIALSPQHISCYSLIVEPETPLFRMVQSNQVKLLDPAVDAELYEFTINFLSSNGYKQYEVSNFAKDNFKCRHNINYWNHSNYLSFGPSAHSFWKNERWWNMSNVASYIEQIEKKILPIAGGEHLNEIQLRDETIFLGLRSEGIDLEQFHKQFGFDLVAKHQFTVQKILQNKLAQIIGQRLQLTSKGYSVCDEICQMFQ
jgi:oxygen-independent coproporphyrinogen III oxidase